MTPWTLPVDVTECVLYKIFSTYLGTQIVLYKEKDGELIFFASLGKDLFCLAIVGAYFCCFQEFSSMYFLI